MTARTSRIKSGPVTHGPTLDDPTPCKPACATCALPLRHCFRQHADICSSTRFTPPHLNSKQEVLSRGHTG